MIDDALGCLLSLVWAPFELWKITRHRSVLGESRMDRETGWLWWKIACILTAVLVVAALLVGWL